MNPERRGERGDGRREREVVGSTESRVEQQAEHADHGLDQDVREKQTPDPERVAGDHPGSERHTTHENGEHQRLRVGGVTQEKL